MFWSGLVALGLVFVPMALFGFEPGRMPVRTMGALLGTGIVFTLLLTATLSPAPAQPTGTSDSAAHGSAAVTRLLEVLRAASTSGLASRAAIAQVEAQRQELAAQSALGTPSFSWHGEGFSGSLGRKLNAIDYYTFVQPFRLPGSGARTLRSEIDDLLRTFPVEQGQQLRHLPVHIQLEILIRGRLRAAPVT